MHWESSGVVGFDLGPLLQGQMRIAKLKSAYNSLIIGPRGFGALSLRWMQFASVLRCARSSFYFVNSLEKHVTNEIYIFFVMGRELLCPPHWGVDILFLLFPPSGIPLGFQTF